MEVIKQSLDNQFIPHFVCECIDNTIMNNEEQYSQQFVDTDRADYIFEQDNKLKKIQNLYLEGSDDKIEKLNKSKFIMSDIQAMYSKYVYTCEMLNKKKIVKDPLSGHCYNIFEWTLDPKISEQEHENILNEIQSDKDTKESNLNIMLVKLKEIKYFDKINSVKYDKKQFKEIGSLEIELLVFDTFDELFCERHNNKQTENKLIKMFHNKEINVENLKKLCTNCKLYDADLTTLQQFDYLDLYVSNESEIEAIIDSIKIDDPKLEDNIKQYLELTYQINEYKRDHKKQENITPQLVKKFFQIYLDSSNVNVKMSHNVTVYIQKYLNEFVNNVGINTDDILNLIDNDIISLNNKSLQKIAKEKTDEYSNNIMQDLIEFHIMEKILNELLSLFTSYTHLCLLENKKTIEKTDKLMNAFNIKLDPEIFIDKLAFTEQVNN